MNSRKFELCLKRDETKEYLLPKIANRKTGVVIPDEEPVFILRGKDTASVETLRFYRITVADSNPDLAGQIDDVIEEFTKFQSANPSLVRDPD